MGVDPASLAITFALNAASMAMTASQQIEGPRLDDLSVTTADFGTPMNYAKGLKRFNGVSIVWAEPLKEVKRRRKTKGGKYNEYTYFGTFAGLVCDHPVEAITRIWFDKHLVYDATGAGPISPFALGGAPITSYMRLYLGAEDELPDPRMSATIDAALGAGSTPAFRNVTGFVFEDLPLEKIGNRLPQVSCEVVTAAAPSFPVDIQTAEVHAPQQGVTFSPDFSRVMWVWGTDFEIWDVAARAPMISGTFDATGDPTGSDLIYGIGLDGRIYCHGGAFGEDIVRYAADGLGPGSVVHATGLGLNFVRVLAYGDEGLELICAVPYPVLGADHNLVYAGMVVDTLTATGVDCSVRDYLRDTHGDVWALCSTATDIVLACLTNENGRLGDVIQVAGPTVPPGDVPVYGFHYSDATLDHFVISWAEEEYCTVDYATGAITNNTAALAMPSGFAVTLANTRPGAATFWTGSGFNSYEVSSKDLSLVRAVDLGDWDVVLNGLVYDPINHALLGNPGPPGFGAMGVAWYFLDRVTTGGLTLRDIVEDVAVRCGLDLADVDASDLDQPVTGYSWTQGSGVQIVEPLLDAYDSLARPHDFELQFIKRGGAVQGTIPTGDMGAGGGVRYTITQAQDGELPRQMFFSFADPALDQQPNNVPVARSGQATDSRGDVSIDLSTLVIGHDEMRNLGEVFLRRKWFEAEGYEGSLSRAYARLEPGDVWGLTLDDVSTTAMLAGLDIGADGVLSPSWLRDAPGVHVSPDLVGGPGDGYVPPVILSPGYTKGFVLDIPLVDDADEGLVTYIAAGPYSDDLFWPGAVIYESADGVTYEDVYDTLGSDRRASWGTCSDVLPDALPEVWDRASVLTVRMRSGTLASATEAQVCNGANMALVGDELLGFMTATLVDVDTYELSNFLRGRRGTEAATAGHASGERFVLMDAEPVRHVMGASTLGDLAYYKPVTSGGLETAGFPQSLTFLGASLKPYAAAHLSVEDVGGDVVAAWVRRTRIGGAWRDLADASLGEGSEAYEVDVLDAGGGVLRTYSGLSSPTVTYDAADQASDGGLGDSLAVYQMSTTVGRGFPASIAL